MAGSATDPLLALVRSVSGRAPDRILKLTLRTRTLPFALVQALRLDTAYVHPVEWTSTMPMMDWLSTGREVSWIIRDSLTGTEGMALDWRVPRDKPLVVRLVNDKHVLHPMGHPIHLHGQRFLVLARNGVPNEDPVWKDTVLVPAGGTVDLLVDTSNPGRWMLHCHIAEHLESGHAHGAESGVTERTERTGRRRARKVNSDHVALGAYRACFRVSLPLFSSFPSSPPSPSFSVLSLHAQTPSPNVQRFVSVDDPVVALTHVRVVDGTGAEPAEDQTVVISGGRISSVGPAGSTQGARAAPR